jgi:hypothetical protein
MARPWITAAQLPTAAWTTLQVAHIPTAATSEQTFSLCRGEKRHNTPCAFPPFSGSCHWCLDWCFHWCWDWCSAHQCDHQYFFTRFPFNVGVRDGFIKGSKVADLLENLVRLYLMGGSRAHRFAKRSHRLVLRPTTPHIWWLSTLSLFPSCLACSMTCLTHGHARSAIPPFNPPCFWA